MIVEDSRVVRELLVHMIASDPRLAVAAACDSAEKALACLERVRPDVISMDVHLPGMNGLLATRRIMETNPTPIVIVSRSTVAGEGAAALESLRYGALAVVEKPSGIASGDYASLTERLCTQLLLMSQVKVIRQRFNRRDGQRAGATCAAPITVVPRPGGSRLDCEMVGIVASTGGPHALEVVLNDLGADFRVPIAIVQHVTASFHEQLVAWLDRVAPLPVVVARNGEQPQPGRVYLAPNDAHLRFARGRFVFDRREPVCGLRPSGTVLLRSMAEEFHQRGLGIVLTGMGDDGAVGLLAMRRRGAATIAEDAATTVVDGMPSAARRLDAVERSLPLSEIGSVVRELVLAPV
jgi:two-component system chemotaxis response regulator CheB